MLGMTTEGRGLSLLGRGMTNVRAGGFDGRAAAQRPGDVGKNGVAGTLLPLAVPCSFVSCFRCHSERSEESLRLCLFLTRFCAYTRAQQHEHTV